MSDIALITFHERKSSQQEDEMPSVLHIDVPSTNDGFQHDNIALKDRGKKDSTNGGPNSNNDRFSVAGTQSLTSEDLAEEYGLHLAAREDSVEAIKAKLTSLANEGHDILRIIDIKDNDGLAPLHHAAKANKKAAAELLLDNEASINLPGDDANTPLHVAAKYNCVAVARLLVERGADINRQNIYGATALHFSTRRGNTEIARLLLDQNGIDIKIKDNGDVTPLHQAAISGDVEITQKLLDQGADIYSKDREGENALHFAASEGNADIVDVLMATFDGDMVDGKPGVNKISYVNQPSDAHDAALHLACTSGYEHCVKRLIFHGAHVNKKSEGKVSPLHLAATSGNIEVAKELLLHKAKINPKDVDQMTPLHKAAMFGKLEMMQFLLERGSLINARDKDNYTPLLAAVWKGQTEAAELLCNKGARMHITDASLKTCVHLVVEYDHIDTLSMLMGTSAIGLVNSTDKDYRTPLHYAALEGNIEALKILLENGAKPDFGDHEEKTPLHHAAEKGKPKCVEILCKTPHVDLNSSDENGRMPIHLAAMKGNIRVIRILANMGAEIDARDDTKWTPLDYAAKEGFFKSVSLLLENDAPVDACDKNKNTPLHWSASNGHVECVNLLLDNGADIALRDIHGKNCLDFAIENNHQNVCMALVTHQRWQEVLDNVDDDGCTPMSKLIKSAPDIAEVVMNKCIVESSHARDNKDFNISYDFKYIDQSPSKRRDHKYSMEPGTMALHHREKLLSHKLTRKLIEHKWAKLGRPIYYFTLLVYLFFVACVTSMVVTERELDRNNQLDAVGKAMYKSTIKVVNQKAFTIIPSLTIAICGFNLIKELFQLFLQRRKYFSQGVNYLEWTLYISTLIFMLPFLKADLITFTMKWNAGAIAILLTWIDLLLFLTRFPYFGLYIVMFVEVLKTVLRVLLVFAIFIVGFALSFYALLREHDTFSTVERSLMKVAVMSIGEIEYDNVFTDNLNKTSPTTTLPMMPMSPLSYTLFSAFLLLMPIIMMNLLVGLAVGDIETVRKTAYIRILKQQVDILLDMEKNYPSFVVKWAYAPSQVVFPNQANCFERLRRFLGYDDEYGYLREEQEETIGHEEEVCRELNIHQKELIKQKKHIKHLKDIVREQNKILKKIALKLNVKEEDNED
eukprot:gene575-1234_t